MYVTLLRRKTTYMIFSNGKIQNVLSVFLQKMNVKYTPTFANKLYNEHPHKYNLFGLSKMLSEYKIENRHENLFSLEVPLWCSKWRGICDSIQNEHRESLVYIERN